MLRNVINGSVYLYDTLMGLGLHHQRKRKEKEKKKLVDTVRQDRQHEKKTERETGRQTERERERETERETRREREIGSDNDEKILWWTSLIIDLML